MDNERIIKVLMAVWSFLALLLMVGCCTGGMFLRVCAIAFSVLNVPVILASVIQYIDDRRQSKTETEEE